MFNLCIVLKHSNIDAKRNFIWLIIIMKTSLCQNWVMMGGNNINAKESVRFGAEYWFARSFYCLESRGLILFIPKWKWNQAKVNIFGNTAMTQKNKANVLGNAKTIPEYFLNIAVKFIANAKFHVQCFQLQVI